jgi:hypothetical protein
LKKDITGNDPKNLDEKSFGELFNYIVKKYNLKPSFFSENSISPSNVSRWKRGILPSPSGLEKILSLDISHDDKMDLAFSVFFEVNKKNQELSLNGIRNYSVTPNNFLSNSIIKEVIKEKWQEFEANNKKLEFTKEFYDPKNNFSNLLSNFIAEENPKEPCFNKFISYIYNKWNFTSPEKLGEALGLKSKDIVREWVKTFSENPLKNIRPETNTLRDICNSEHLEVTKKDELLLWQLSRGRFDLIKESNPLLHREALLFKFQEEMSNTNRSSVKLNISSDFLRSLNELTGFTNVIIAERTGISASKLKHQLYDRKLARLSNHNPKEAFELGKFFYPDDKDNAKDCAAVLMQKEAFLDKEAIENLYLDKKIDTRDLFVFSRIFIRKQSLEDFAKTVGASGARTINEFEDGIMEKPPYEVALNLFKKVLQKESKEEFKKFLDVFKEESVENGLVSKKGYIDDALQRKKETRQILVEVGILR